MARAGPQQEHGGACASQLRQIEIVALFAHEMLPRRYQRLGMPAGSIQHVAHHAVGELGFDQVDLGGMMPCVRHRHRIVHAGREEREGDSPSRLH